MKKFGGPVLFLDRNDINTDEIIPAKYLTENSKIALAPFVLEDLKLAGFDPASDAMRTARAVVTRANFGCGSSREHAVWVFEVNDINMVIGESFARIFRQNMFNCGMLALELGREDIEALFGLGEQVEVSVALDQGQLIAKNSSTNEELTFHFTLDSFDLELIKAGGWLAYADQNY